MSLFHKEHTVSIYTNVMLFNTPGFPHFYYMLGANLGSLLHGDVFVMTSRKANHLID